ncbi:MAG TPA: metal-dependent transcriptional regulator [Kiritimatiellia bacterium]|jgi:DtxR family Mn-dependent transcriptional regulator
MPSSTVENYIKQIYLEQQNTGNALVPMGRLAELMRVAPGTTTTMMKALADSGLVAYEPRNGTRLTPGGEQLALHILRRHRLIELFLVKVLGLDWSEVHIEAEELEHAISDKVLDRLDALLGNPTVDPHGDPIPTSQGRVPEIRLDSLQTCPVNVPLQVARVLDQRPQFLQFVERSGLTPGALIVIESRDPAAESVVLRLGKTTVTLGATAAGKILVSPAG